MYNEKLKNKIRKEKIKMNDLIIKKDISKMIYNLNGVKIILDEDLASLMNIDTKSFESNCKKKYSEIL